MYMKDKNGITLISLIITIVIMLILAGVSVSFIVGQNGLFKKSSSSAKAYNESAVKEELQLVSNSAYLTDTNEEVTNEMIADGMSNDLDDIVWQDKSKLAGNYKGFDFYIDDNHNVIMEKLVIAPLIVKNLSKLDWYAANNQKINKISIEVNSNPVYSENALDGYKWDISEDGKNGILAYFVNSGNADVPYDLHIVGKKRIVMPEDSSKFFCAFSYVRELIGIENLDASNVKNANNMFSYFGFQYLTELDLKNDFDTSNVTDMSFMFAHCGQSCMKTFKLGNKFNTEKVTNMQNMFDNCGALVLQQLDVSMFNTKNVTNMSMMFSNCGIKKLASFNIGTEFDTSKVTNFSCMFQSFGQSLAKFDVGPKFTLENATDIRGVFKGVGMSGFEFRLNHDFKMPTSCTSNESAFLCSPSVLYCPSTEQSKIKTIKNYDGTYPSMNMQNI